MKPARITFLALFTLGFMGGLGNAWQGSAYVKLTGGSQIQATLDSLFSFAGLIDYVIAPTLFAIYVSLIVAGYQKFVKPKVSQKFKALSVILTIVGGILGQFILIALFYSLIS
jgi:hypothetical protein